MRPALVIEFEVTDESIDGISFDMAFGSEEFPEFVGSSFNDAFGCFLDGQNVTFDSNGNPLSVNNNFFELNNSGITEGAPVQGKTVVDLNMEYDGFTPTLRTNAALSVGTHTLKFVIADAGDSILDSGIYLSNLQFQLTGPIGTGQAEVNITVSTASETTLVGYFRFDDGGTMVQDFSESDLQIAVRDRAAVPSVGGLVTTEDDDPTSDVR